MEYPYVPFKKKYIPMIPIEVKSSEWVNLYAYVDSGASYSVFHSDIAEILSLNYEDGEKTYITVFLISVGFFLYKNPGSVNIL